MPGELPGIGDRVRGRDVKQHRQRNNGRFRDHRRRLRVRLAVVRGSERAIGRVMMVAGGHRRGFIARAFEWHYFSAAAIASACGAVLAGVGFLAAGSLDEFGIASVSFLPPLGLPLRDLPWLALVPVSAAIIAWATARISVIAALHEHY